MATKSETRIEIGGCLVEKGYGHNWKPIRISDMDAETVKEIEDEIRIGRLMVPTWTASNGERFCWWPGARLESEIVRKIADILENQGRSFSGSDRKAAMELAQEWFDADFTDGEVDEWCRAGYWSNEAAYDAREAGHTPKSEVSYRPGDDIETMSPVYALCNGDISVSDLVWVD